MSSYFPEEHLCSFSCSFCTINKSQKLPFPKSSITSSSPLVVIFSDVLTSPVFSFDGFHYYFIFVDHFTKYIWFYPLSCKSDVHLTFVTLKQLVENYFTITIKTLYTDNGGEFLALWSFLTTHGITHFTTPPHTPKHNGYSECRHRHIVETGLTLLHQASIPLTFWSYAFSTTIYLINRMTKVGLSLGSSFENYSKHFLTHPNSVSSVIYVFPSYVPTLPTNSTPNIVCVSFSTTPLLRVPSSVLTTLKKNLCITSCQVYGECFPVLFPPPPPPPPNSRIAGNGHKLFCPCFLVHLG